MKNIAFLMAVKRVESILGHELTLDYVRMTGAAKKIIRPHRFTMPNVKVNAGGWMAAAVAGLIRQSSQLSPKKPMSLVIVDGPGCPVLESVTDFVADFFVSMIEGRRKSILTLSFNRQQLAFELSGAASPLAIVIDSKDSFTVYSVANKQGAEESPRFWFEKLFITPLYLKEEVRLQAPAGLFAKLAERARRERHECYDDTAIEQLQDWFGGGDEARDWIWPLVAEIPGPIVSGMLRRQRVKEFAPVTFAAGEPEQMHRLMQHAVDLGRSEGAARSNVAVYAAGPHGPVDVYTSNIDARSKTILIEIAAALWPRGEKIVGYEGNRDSAAIMGPAIHHPKLKAEPISAHERLAATEELARFLKSRNFSDAEIDRLLSDRS